MPTFSLIVPVYQIEEFLPKCVSSVLAQSCQDYELLLVDDGSPDGCGELCDEYARRYPSVRTVHQENGGAGAARNHGIHLAKGEYLLFLDGDDYLSPNLLADLKVVIDATPADLILFGAFVERNGREVGQLHESVEPNRLLSVKDTPNLYFGVMAPWNRAYRRCLFTDSDVTFATKVWYEDIRVVTKLLALAQTALRLPGCYYHYLQREGSAMNNRNSDRNVQILEAFDDIVNWYRAHGLYAAHREEITFQAIEHILLAATVRVLLIDPKHPLIEEFRSYMERSFPDFRANPYLSRLSRSKRLAYSLLLKKRYRTVRLLFRIKNRIGK